MYVPAAALLGWIGASALAANSGELDHERAVTIIPLRLIDPRLHLEYENKLRSNTSFTVGVSFGKRLLLTRQDLNLLSVVLVDTEVWTFSSTGFNGAFNYYFKDFNRGWYIGPSVEYDRITAATASGESGQYSCLELGPTIGWKRAAKGGLTVSFDAGVGYAAVFGVDLGEGMSLPDEVAWLGSINLGYSF